MKLIDYNDVQDNIDIYHFGWSQDEITAKVQEYQTRYYGDANDALFEVIDSEGYVYYAVFRTAAVDWCIVHKAKDHLLFDDDNRALLNIGTKIYRYMINERIVLDNEVYKGLIKYNDIDKLNSPFFHSLTSTKHQVMIIVDDEGIAAMNWDRVLWKHEIKDAASGDLTLKSIDDEHILAEDFDKCSFDIKTGEIINK